MNELGENPPALRVERGIDDTGTGHIRCTFLPQTLEAVLRAEGATSAKELPEVYLRAFCGYAHNEGWRATLDAAERLGVHATIDVGDGVTGPARISTRDVGYDMVKRLSPLLSDAEQLRYDPDYSPVRLEIAVHEPPGFAKIVLQVVLHPPDLAHA